MCTATDKANRYRKERDKLAKALRAILKIDTADTVKFCRKADLIAFEAIASFEAEAED